MDPEKSQDTRNFECSFVEIMQGGSSSFGTYSPDCPTLPIFSQQPTSSPMQQPTASPMQQPMPPPMHPNVQPPMQPHMQPYMSQFMYPQMMPQIFPQMHPQGINTTEVAESSGKRGRGGRRKVAGKKPARKQAPRQEAPRQEAPVDVDSEGDGEDVDFDSEGEGDGDGVRGSNYSHDEDVLLLRSYLAISCDAIVNTDQTGDCFWTRVYKRYNEQRGDLKKRCRRGLQSRYDKIKQRCSKFSKYWWEAQRKNVSGWSDNDKASHAIAEYHKWEKKPFRLMHCWDILKFEPKWMDVRHYKGSPGIVDIDTPNVEAGASVEEPSVSAAKRPPGRDASKAAKRRGSSSSSSSADICNALQTLQLILQDKNDVLKEEVRTNREAMEKKQERLEKKQDRLFAIEEEKMAMERRRLDIEEKKAENEAQARERAEEREILAKDLNMLPPPLRLWYEVQQKKIMAKLATERDAADA